MLVDADTGAVIDGSNARLPLPPASVGKVLTALLAVERLPAGAQAPVSPRAAAMPASKVGLVAGQTWPVDDLLQALMLVSANDAAVALAERVGGSLPGFRQEMALAATRLRLADQPILQDPAGLDDESSVDGGNRISARDLAIVTRAALAVPQIRSIVAEPEFRFRGPDGLDHRYWNHNPLLRTYPGAIGVKTGYTRLAGHSLIGAATRDGRTMIAVVLGAADPARSTAQLLDRGFATPVAAEAALDHLPAFDLAALRRPAPWVVGGTSVAPSAAALGRRPITLPLPAMAFACLALAVTSAGLVFTQFRPAPTALAGG